MIIVPDEFLNFLRVEEANSIDDSLNEQRAAAIDFYNGEPFGDEEEGRSQLVTRDVAEVIDYTTVSVLRTMISGDKVVEFEAADEDEPEEQEALDQEPQAKPPNVGDQITASVQYQFMRKQKGYRILHDSLKAGLMEKTGIVKSYAEPQPPKVEVYEVPAEALDDVDGPPTFNGNPILKGDPLDADWVPGQPSSMWRIEVELPQPPLFRDMAVPNEEFRCAADTVDLDESAYLAHAPWKSLSQLRQMGFEFNDDELWGAATSDTQIERARDAARSKDRNSIGARQGAARQVQLLEEYVLYDLDGDGILERLCVHRVGQHILSVQEVDEQPFSLWSPFPMQHRLVGQSQADKTMDIQRTRSVVLRQFMDNVYQSNNPRVAVPEEGMTENTIDDLLTVRPGALIRYKQGGKPEAFTVPFVAGAALEAMEFMSGERESRTGITRHNQGLNPDTLNKTASGMAMLQQAGDQIEGYIARNFAEFLVAPMFAKRYRLMRKFGQPFRMKIDGQFVTIDPRQWPEEIDMAINVGLGSGRKDQRLQYRMTVLGVQKECMAQGLRIVGEEQIYNSAKGVIADANLGNANDFFVDPATLGDVEEKPDPETAKAQADAVLKAQKLQGEQEEQARRDELSRIQLEADLQRQAERDARELHMKEARAQAEFDLALRKQDMDRAIAERQQDIEIALAARAQRSAGGDGGLNSYRPGGDLDA